MGEAVSKARADRAEAFERWAERVDPSDLVPADTDTLRRIAELSEQRAGVEAELADAVRSARRANRSWSEIGAMLGVSKQAAQRKYAKRASA